MKARTITLFLAAAVTTAGLDLPAQSNPRQSRPAVSVSAGSVTPAVTKMSLVELPEGSLKDAVRNLKSRLETEKLLPMNIIYSRGAENLEIPDLTLRNVTGSDALRLICTAADCEMEPIFSETDTPQGRVSEYVIGYRINPRVPNVNPYRSRSMTSAPTIRANPTSSTTFTRSARTVAPAKSLLFGNTSASKSTTSGAVKTSGGGTRLVSYGQAKPVLLTRVYALGRITTRAKFPEVEKTLLATLQVAGHKPSDATLALHETTNVLVVRAPNDIQDLVSELLESLAKNSADADTGEVANLERKLKAILIEMENVKRDTEMRMQEAEMRRREAEDELTEVSRKLREVQKSRESKK
ncbi:MAG: hypothetical protein ACPGVU_24215 [Limisphaerales bacterium]